MATIHMDADAARGIQRKLVKLQRSITNAMRPANVTVSNLQPSWRGNSASEFFALYSESSGQIAGIAERLGEIAEELSEEIERWERIAENLSR